MTIQWTLKKLQIKDLHPYEKNPRTINKEQFKQVRASVQKFGLIDKPIVNQDLVIIGGHQRIQALKKEGIKEVDCWYPERKLDAKEVEECNIRLNKAHGAFDFDTLANEFEIPDLINWGFDPAEFEDYSIEDVGEEKDKVEKVSKCPHCGLDI